MKASRKPIILGLSAALLLPAAMLGAEAEIPVTVTMNSVSKTMTLRAIGSDTQVVVGEPEGYVYSFDVPEGRYTLTAYANESTSNGTIVLDVTAENSEFNVLTNTVYATNSGWVPGTDYTVSTVVQSRSGEKREIELGQSTTANRLTFLALTGDSYTSTFTPSESRALEGYGTGFKTGTLTANTTVSYAISQAYDYTVTVPAEASFRMGIKGAHFTDFINVEPKGETVDGGMKTLTFNLLQSQVYNYRTSIDGGLTMAGYFTMQSDPAKRPELNFTDADYKAYDPHRVNHDVMSNNGYETGDILLNINEKGFLRMEKGETFKAHAMRMWELTDNVVNNYFIEPDFHYTVIGLDGNPADDLLEIVAEPGSAWADIKAKSEGTAIVLVSYDAIKLNYFSGADKKEYTGGEFWGAIWPENTGVFVVSVGGAESAARPEFLVNEKYNDGAQKMAGKYVDAEHDVFYYLDGEEGFSYTFNATGARSVTLAYPEIGSRMATYRGFGTDGVTDNGDGTFTVTLKEGRQIVKIDDASGNSVYQVFTAKTCDRVITNATRPGSDRFQPGDRVDIQYSGLRHPANKIAGIYNMSAYVTFNGIPNGSSLIQGSGQYTFGSAPSAQLVTVEIPDSYDAVSEPVMVLDEGVIQVNGFGDPIGNHRNTDPVAGRSPNFTAVAHKTYFGAVPEVRINVSPKFMFDITVDTGVEGCDVKLSREGEELEPDAQGHYTGTFGTYSLYAGKDGYRAIHREFTLTEGDDGKQTFAVEMTQAPGAWDGKTLAPAAVDGSGRYVVETPAQLAWLASQVNDGNSGISAVLANDIDLGDYYWTPIGNNSSRPFKGIFTGAGHRVAGLWAEKTQAGTDYIGLFGYVQGASTTDRASITGITVDGYVSGESYVGGVAAYLYRYADIDTCANYATVHSSKEKSSYAGGIVGYVNNADFSLRNSYNAGAVTGGSYQGGLIGRIPSGSTNVENVFNVGEITDLSGANACFGYATSSMDFETAFAVKDYTNTYGYTLVDDQRMQSGEIAFILGDAFGQTIGEDPYPVFGGRKVYYDESTDLYYNEIESIAFLLDTDDDKVDADARKLKLAAGDTYLLTVTALPKGAVLPTLEWTSTDDSVAKIESKDTDSAVVTANRMGVATVKVSHAGNPDINDTCDILVDGTTRIADLFDGDDSSEIEVYDLHGRLISNSSVLTPNSLNPGIYIVRRGDTVRKILVTR